MFNAIEVNALKNQLTQIIGSVRKQKTVLAELFPHAVFHASNKSKNGRLEALNKIVTAVQEFSDGPDLLSALKAAVKKSIHGVEFSTEKQAFVFKDKNIKSRNLINGFENINFLELKPKKSESKKGVAPVTSAQIVGRFNKVMEQNDGDASIVIDALADWLESEPMSELAESIVYKIVQRFGLINEEHAQTAAEILAEQSEQEQEQNAV